MNKMAYEMAKRKFKEKFSSEKESWVEFEGIRLYLNLDEDDYEQARTGVLLEDPVIVHKDDAEAALRLPKIPVLI